MCYNECFNTRISLETSRYIHKQEIQEKIEREIMTSVIEAMKKKGKIYMHKLTGHFFNSDIRERKALYMDRIFLHYKFENFRHFVPSLFDVLTFVILPPNQK